MNAARRAMERRACVAIDQAFFASRSARDLATEDGEIERGRIWRDAALAINEASIVPCGRTEKALGGAGEQRGDWRRLLVAAGIGAGVSALVAWGVKRKLEADFGAGAEEIRDELTDRGSVLRAEIEVEAGAAGREAALGALRDWGVTPELIRDVGVLADAAADLVGMASSTGMTLDTMLAQVQARAAAIRAGAVRSFA
jgi:hypothetical protein